MSTQTAPALMDIGELCRTLGVRESWVYRRTSKGHPDPLPFVKIGGLLRFDPAEIREWVERRGGEEHRAAS
jgi:excisionase family DNA binding protein